MYKLINIDLDGTLLNSYGEVSIENKKAIKEAIEKGVEVVIASGRVYTSIENIANEIGANNYIISGNGSMLYDVKNREILYENYMNKQKVLDLVKICEENSIYYNIYTENSVIAKSLNYNVLFYHHENKNKKEEKRTNINIVEDIYKYIQESKTNKFLKITICDNNQIVFGSIIRKLRKIKDIDVLDVAHMSKKTIKSGTEDVKVEYFYTEITNKKVDKWTAIEILMEKNNIKREEVISIGDNVNDQNMIINSGIGVAMGNSAPYIKEIADFVTEDNNSDGVAKAIRQYIP